MAPKKTGSKGNGAGSGADAGTKKRTSAGSGKAAANSETPKAGRTTKTRAAGPDLTADLRQFVSENPNGWGHDEWLSLLHRLQERGHSVDDTEQIGRTLERERLTATLQRVQGVGPQRVKAIADRYGNIWNLLYADVDDLVQATNIPRSLAERIKASV